jgi:hypothetical protein
VADVATAEDDTTWMQGILQLLPDGWYELTALAEDGARDMVVPSAIFRGTHMGEGSTAQHGGTYARG